MNSVRWRALLAAALMIAGAVLTHFGRPTVYLADQIGKPELETLFPKQFGSWQIDASRPIIVPPPDVQAALDAIYNQVLTRTYIDAGGRRMMLSVAYGGDQYDGTSAHRPETCYPAQGFDITFNARRTQQLAQGSLGVRTLVARLGGRNEPITYWVVVGDKIATTGVEQKLAQMRYGLRGVIADGMLVRVSSIDSDAAKAHAAQAGFIAELAAALPGPARARVFGVAGP
jgi:EpsI family protein